MTRHTDNTAPERIWACPDKVENWRWPFASRFPVQHNAPMFEYTLSSTVSALIADAEHRGREAATEELLERLRGNWSWEDEDFICVVIADLRKLALRTSPAEPSDAVATVTAQEAALEVLDGLNGIYKSRNGRDVSIEGDDGEKCWILSNDGYEALRALAGASK